MAKLPRVCSEGPHQLPADAPASRKTCSTACRQKRARRLAKQKDERNQASIAVRSMTAEQKEALTDVAHEVMAEELRPVVREALTEENMRSLRAMVGLLPGLVEELAKDIHDKDPMVRQKAHTLLLRYTQGQAVALPTDDNPGAGLVVNLTMPRPDTTAPEAQPVDATEVRTCDVCQEEKPSPEFVGESSRCRQCMKQLQSKVTAFLGESDGD